MSAPTDPLALVRTFLNEIETRRNELPDSLAAAQVGRLPARLQGIISGVREEDAEIVRNLAREQSVATQDHISRKLGNRTALDSKLWELTRIAEARRVQARGDWFCGLPPEDKAIFDEYCLTIAGPVLQPVFLQAFPACLRGPLARLALEHARIARRADTLRKESEKSLIARGMGNRSIVESVLGGFTQDEKEAQARLLGRWLRVLTPEQEAVLDPSSISPTPGQFSRAGGGSKKKGGGGRRLLEKSDPHKFQVYDRIRRDHQPSAEYRETVDRLKADRQFVEQVSEAGLKLNTLLVKRALAFFDQRNRGQAAKKQETDQT